MLKINKYMLVLRVYSASLINILRCSKDSLVEYDEGFLLVSQIILIHLFTVHFLGRESVKIMGNHVIILLHRNF